MLERTVADGNQPGAQAHVRAQRPHHRILRSKVGLHQRPLPFHLRRFRLVEDLDRLAAAHPPRPNQRAESPGGEDLNHCQHHAGERR